MGMRYEGGQVVPSDITIEHQIPDRTKEMMLLMVRGFNQEQIGHEYSLVRDYVRNIFSGDEGEYKALEVSNARAAVLRGVEVGQISLRELAFYPDGTSVFDWVNRVGLSPDQENKLSLLVAHPDFTEQELSQLLGVTKITNSLTAIYLRLQFETHRGYKDVGAAVMYFLAKFAEIDLTKDGSDEDLQKLRAALGVPPPQEDEIQETEQIPQQFTREHEALEAMQRGGKVLVTTNLQPGPDRRVPTRMEIDAQTLRVVAFGQSREDLLEDLPIRSTEYALVKGDQTLLPFRIQNGQWGVCVIVDNEIIQDENSVYNAVYKELQRRVQS